MTPVRPRYRRRSGLRRSRLRGSGDPVIFVVNDAGPPVVLGALAGHCSYGEDFGVHIGRDALFHGKLHVGTG